MNADVRKTNKHHKHMLRPQHGATKKLGWRARKEGRKHKRAGKCGAKGKIKEAEALIAQVQQLTQSARASKKAHNRCHRKSEASAQTTCQPHRQPREAGGARHSPAMCIDKLSGGVDGWCAPSSCWWSTHATSREPAHKLYVTVLLRKHIARQCLHMAAIPWHARARLQSTQASQATRWSNLLTHSTTDTSTDALEGLHSHPRTTAPQTTGLLGKQTPAQHGPWRAWHNERGASTHGEAAPAA